MRQIRDVLRAAWRTPRGWSIALAAGAKTREICESFLQLALEPAFDGAVEDRAFHPLGKVVLPGKSILGIMVIGIAVAIALILHQLRGGVEDMPRRWFASGLLGLAHRGLVGGVAGVGFRREGQIGDGLRQRQFAFGAAKTFVGFPSVQTDSLGLR